MTYDFPFPRNRDKLWPLKFILKNMVITTDTLVENVHFPKDTLPYDIGYKALAVNLSDIAAMGASPAYTTMECHPKRQGWRVWSKKTNSLSLEMIV